MVDDLGFVGANETSRSPDSEYRRSYSDPQFTLEILSVAGESNLSKNHRPTEEAVAVLYQRAVTLPLFLP